MKCLSCPTLAALGDIRTNWGTLWEWNDRTSYFPKINLITSGIASAPLHPSFQHYHISLFLTHPSLSLCTPGWVGDSNKNIWKHSGSTAFQIGRISTWEGASVWPDSHLWAPHFVPDIETPLPLTVNACQASSPCELWPSTEETDYSLDPTLAELYQHLTPVILKF